jgi:hypothetical protein
VRAVKERLNAVARSRDPILRLTWRSFARRIGLSHDDALAEEALRLRLRKESPTPFSAEELAVICQEFGVRADYLLRGHGPMLVDDEVAAEAVASPVAFSRALPEQD